MSTIRRSLIALSTVIAAATAPSVYAAGLQALDDAQLSEVHGQFGEQQLASLVTGKALEQLSAHQDLNLQDATQMMRALSERQNNNIDTAKQLLQTSQTTVSVSMVAAVSALMPMFALPLFALMPTKNLVDSLQQISKVLPPKS